MIKSLHFKGHVICKSKMAPFDVAGNAAKSIILIKLGHIQLCYCVPVKMPIDEYTEGL